MHNTLHILISHFINPVNMRFWHEVCSEGEMMAAIHIYIYMQRLMNGEMPGTCVASKTHAYKLSVMNK